MDSIINVAKKHKITLLNSEYIKTRKNQQVGGFYNRCGFNVMNDTDSTTKYSLEVNNYKTKEIEYIRIKNGN